MFFLLLFCCIPGAAAASQKRSVPVGRGRSWSGRPSILVSVVALLFIIIVVVLLILHLLLGGCGGSSFAVLVLWRLAAVRPRPAVASYHIIVRLVVCCRWRSSSRSSCRPRSNPLSSSSCFCFCCRVSPCVHCL